MILYIIYSLEFWNSLWNFAIPKRKGVSSNHHFSGAWLVKLRGCIYTWNPNDPCFGRFNNHQNKGQTGSIYIYIYLIIFMEVGKIPLWFCHDRTPLRFALAPSCGALHILSVPKMWLKRMVFFDTNPHMMFPKIGTVPQNGWWKAWKTPLKMGWIWGENPLFSETSIYAHTNPDSSHLSTLPHAQLWVSKPMV